MSGRNEGTNIETTELDSSDEENPINPEVRILSRIFGVHRASVASMPGTSGAGHTAHVPPVPRRTPRERDRMFWTLLGNSSRMLNTRCRGPVGARPPRPAAFADLLEPDRRARFALTHPPSVAPGYPATSASFSSLQCSLRNLLRKRLPPSPSGNVAPMAGPGVRPVLVLRAAAGPDGQPADPRLRRVERDCVDPRLRRGVPEDPRLRRAEPEDPRLRRGELDDPRLRRGELEDPRLRRGDLEDQRLRRGDLEDPRLRRGNHEPEDPRLRRVERERSDRGDRGDRVERSDRDDRSDHGDQSDRGDPSDPGDRSDRGDRSEQSDRHHSSTLPYVHEEHAHVSEPLILDDLDVSEAVPGPAPTFSPRADYFGDEPLQVEEPLNMSTGALLEEEILEVDGEREGEGEEEREGEAAPRPASTDLQEEPADASAESSQQRGAKRKREVTGDTPDSALALNQSILRLLECPVCMEWMEPPIAQCRRGHLVCGTCRKRLETCPVCRTPFSSVRNRAMEDVAGVLRYPCRHGCARWLRAPRRHKHEASCAHRRHACPLPACRSVSPMPRAKLTTHCQSKHPESFRTGTVHVVQLGVRTEQHVQWIVSALDALFHVRVDMDVRAWGVCALVQHLGPQDQATRYTYEVTVNGRHSGRRLVYRRATHSDLESPMLNTSRQDCFHLTLDQALNYLRFKNEHSETDKSLDLTVTLAEAEPEEVPPEED